MTIQQIQDRQDTEAQVYDIAKQIRALLDTAAKIELPDDRDAVEEILELVQGEDD